LDEEELARVKDLYLESLAALDDDDETVPEPAPGSEESAPRTEDATSSAETEGN
jgi:hypothetical protein